MEQINKALAQMDEVTQQNSALVEENAASAKALEHQSTTMDERVSLFQLEEEPRGGKAREVAAKAPVAKLQPVRAAPKPVARAKSDAPRGAVAQMQSKVATAFKQEPDWKEF